MTNLPQEKIGLLLAVNKRIALGNPVGQKEFEVAVLGALPALLDAHDQNDKLRAMEVALVLDNGRLGSENVKLRALLKEEEWNGVDPDGVVHCTRCGIAKEGVGGHDFNCEWKAVMG